MKTYSLILSLALCSTTTLANGRYEEQMLKTIAAIYQADTVTEFMPAINTFERIAAAEKSKWEPYYYASFGYLMLATREPDGAKKDILLDKADAGLKSASELAPSESEIAALAGFVLMMRVTVDPAARGPQVSGQAFAAFSKAIALNPENPRALALMAQMQLGTAKFFNMPATEACETARKAAGLFDLPVSNPLAPSWGRPMNEALLAQCK
jgi:hypothetical protein